MEISEARKKMERVKSLIKEHDYLCLTTRLMTKANEKKLSDDCPKEVEVILINITRRLTGIEEQFDVIFKP
jgi:hypothetical protein